MSNKARNYTIQTIKLLFGKNNGQCSFPDCKNKIIAEDGTVVGQIAHIQAASKKGPRYNPPISDEERASFSNLMLLCDKHHKMIDNKANEDEYSIELLKSWKAEHEAKFEKDKIEVPDTVIEQITAKLELSIKQLLNQYIAFDEIKDFGIIEEIFNYVFNEIIEENYDTKINQEKLLDLKLKIPENFYNTDDKKIIEQYFNDLWFRKNIIETFVSNANQEKIISLKIDIQKNYRENRNVKDIEIPIDDFKIIERMAGKYIPKKQLSNPDFFANATALVLYFFEQCDFGKKTVKEQNTNNQLNLF